MEEEQFVTPGEFYEEQPPDDNFYDTEQYNDTAFFDFVRNPSRETVQKLNDEDIKTLVAVAIQVDRGDKTQVIMIEDDDGKRYDISSELSKQILNYVNGWRVKCDFGKCVQKRTGNIGNSYGPGEFFSKQECENKCSGLPFEIVDTITNLYVENDAILDKDGVRLKSSGIYVNSSQYYLVRNLEVEFTGSDRNLVNTLNKFLSLTHLTIVNKTKTLDYSLQSISGLDIPTLSHLIFVGGFNYPIDQINLPSLTYLKFDKLFNQPIDSLNCSGLTYLDLGDSFNRPINDLDFSNLKYLKCMSLFNGPINGLNLSNLTHLELGNGFNQSIDNLNLSNLTYLKLGDQFNQPIERLRLSNLTHLELGYEFNQSINLLNTSNLIYLKIRGKFNQPINNMNFSKLAHLEFGINFNQPLIGLDLAKLTYIKMGYYFNQSIDKLNLSNLKELHVGHSFNQDIYKLNIQKLTHLTLGWAFNKRFDIGKYPLLKYLVINTRYEEQLERFQGKNGLKIIFTSAINFR